MNLQSLKFLLFPCTLSAIGIFLFNNYFSAYANPHAWYILIYYSVFTLATHVWLTKNQDAKTFVMRFMGVTGIKLFLNLIIILVYGLTHRKSAVSFAIYFLGIYFLFTFFESYRLIRNTNSSKEKLPS
jgi:hypothetical protein